MNNCRSCGAPILWVKHAVTGRTMPVEPVPEEEAPAAVASLFVVRDRTASGRILFARPAAGELYRSHFATCPDADRWRGGGS